MPLAFAFAAIAGYADAVGYLRFKAFAGMMTGNTVLMGLALFQRAELPVWEYAGVLLIFFGASCFGYGAFRLRCPPLAIFLAEAVALILPDFAASAWSVVPLVIAMGLQNPLATRLGVALNTTFITGDSLHFAEGLAGLVLRHPARQAGFAIYGITWLAYAAGAAGGAAGDLFLSWPLVVPVAVLIYIYGQAWRAGALTISRR